MYYSLQLVGTCRNTEGTSDNNWSWRSPITFRLRFLIAEVAKYCVHHKFIADTIRETTPFLQHCDYFDAEVDPALYQAVLCDAAGITINIVRHFKDELFIQFTAFNRISV